MKLTDPSRLPNPDAYEKAEETQRAALAIANDEFGDSDEKTLKAARNLGSILGAYLGRYEEAIEIWNQTLSVHENILGKEHEATEYVRTRLAEDQQQLAK